MWEKKGNKKALSEHQTRSFSISVDLGRHMDQSEGHNDVFIVLAVASPSNRYVIKYIITIIEVLTSSHITEKNKNSRTLEISVTALCKHDQKQLATGVSLTNHEVHLPSKTAEHNGIYIKLNRNQQITDHADQHE